MITRLIKPTVIVSLFLFIASPALAIGKPDGVGARPNASAQATGAVRACQARESAIKTRMTRLTNLAANMETKFDSIAGRVKNYYTSKVLPSGKTVANYDSLVANIATQKTAVASALTQAQANINSFNCASGNAKAQLTQFRQDMQAVKSTLKDYRTSIKNLIVAVRSVTGSQNSETESSKSGGNQ